MKKTHKSMADGFVRDIQAASEPGRMTKAEALAFLEEIMADLEGSAEALREELADR